MKSKMIKATIEKYYTIFAAIGVPIFAAYFFYFACNDVLPIHEIRHWIYTLENPNVGACGGDTIDFGDEGAVIMAGRLRTNLGCYYDVWLDPNDLLGLAIGDSPGHKEYTMKLLDDGARLGRFDKSTYVFTSDRDTIYLELNILFATDLRGYGYFIEAHFPGDRFYMCLDGSGFDVSAALEAIKKYVYRDEGRSIIYNRELTEVFLR